MSYGIASALPVAFVAFVVVVCVVCIVNAFKSEVAPLVDAETFIHVMGCAVSTPSNEDETDGRRRNEDGTLRLHRGGSRNRRRRNARRGGADEGEDAAVRRSNSLTPLRVKLVLLGASNAGKTALSARYVRDTFSPDTKATVGAAFASHTTQTEGGRRVKFEIWDTAGQERYASLAPLYYRGATAALVVYDGTDVESFERAKYWVGELERHGDPECAVVLCGNKTDLYDAEDEEEEEDEEDEGLETGSSTGEGTSHSGKKRATRKRLSSARAVSEEEAEALVTSANLSGRVETSARTGAGVREAFDFIAERVSERSDRRERRE